MRSLLILSSDHLAGEGYATDLSMQGMRVLIEGPVPIGTKFWVHLCYREASPALLTYYHAAVEIELAVARWSTTLEVGLHIQHMSRTNAERLRQLLGRTRGNNGEVLLESRS